NLAWPALEMRTASLPQPAVFNVLEASEHAYANLDDLVRHVCGFRTYYGRQDARRNSLTLLAWDYRGRIERLEACDRQVKFAVSPRNDPQWRALVMPTSIRGAPLRGSTVNAPSVEAIDIGEELREVDVLLRNANEDIDWGRARPPRKQVIPHESEP